MLILDKANDTNVLTVTLSELTVNTSPLYEFQIFNFYTNVSYYWTASNVSLVSTNDRRDIIEINLSNEEQGRTIEEGQYKYSFLEVIGTDRVEVEKGLLNVINSATSSVYYEITPDEDDDDFIVYNG